MNKRVRYLAVLALLAVCMLSACQKTKTEQAPEEPEERVSLVYWTMWEKSSNNGKAIKAAADSYESETGVKIQIEYKGDEFVRDGLAAAIDKGTVIDLFDYDLGYMNSNWEEYLLELEEYVAAANYEERAWDALISLAREEGGGVIRSIPYRPVVYAIYYNKDLFREAGVWKEPVTWEDFEKACIKLRAAGFTPITADDEYALLLLGHHLARYIGEEDVRQIVEEEDWDNAALEQAVRDYEQLAQEGAFSKYMEVNIAPSGQLAELAGKEAAMYLGYSTIPDEVSETAGEDFNWGCFSYPEVTGGVDGRGAVQYSSKAVGIHKDTEYPQEAFDFIRFMTQGEQEAAFSEQAGIIPSDTDNANWPDLLVPARSVWQNIESRYSWAAGIESNSQVKNQLKENFLKVCAGRMTTEEFLNAMKTGQ